jgi:hypothetical protein
VQVQGDHADEVRDVREGGGLRQGRPHAPSRPAAAAGGALEGAAVPAGLLQLPGAVEALAPPRRWS